MTTPVNSRLMAQFKSFASAASLGVMLIGSLALVGWGFNIGALKSILPGLATMKANTALSFMLAGASLWLLSSAPVSSARRLVGLICAAIVAVLALLTLSQDVFGWNLGLDQLLFRDTPAPGSTAPPGRMSPATAVNFSLIGGALLLLDVKWGWRAAQGLALLAGTVALLALVGYTYNVQSLYRISPFSSVALHTAFTFLLLALAILAARPHRGIMALITEQSVSGSMLRRLLPAALIIPFVLGWLRLQGQRAGWYDTEMGLAIFALSNMFTFTGLVWWNARLLHQADRERQQTETARRESEEKYRILLEAMADGVFVAQDYRFVFANRALPAMLGYTEETFIGRPFEEIIAPEFLTVWTERFTQRIAGGPLPPNHYQVRFLCNGGVESLWIELRASLVQYHGRPAVMGIIRDITARKQIEESLQRSEQTLKLFVEYAPAAIAMFDRNMNYLAASRRYLADYRLNEPTLVGRSHYEIFPEVPERWKEIHRRCLAGAIEKCAEDPFARADGGLDWVRWEVHPWYDHSSEIGGVILFSEVITERKQTEQKLREKEEQFRATFEQAAVGIAQVGLDGRWLQVNQKLCHIIGYTQQELQQLTFQDITHPDDLAGDLEYVRQMLAGEIQTYTLEKRYLPKGGGFVWINLTVALVREASGEPKYFISVVEDIQRRKKMEEKEKQMTAELTRSNAELEQFAYIASHDLQEPLRAVAGMLQLLQQRYAAQLDTRAEEFIGHAVDGATRMQTLISDLLNFSRVGTRGQPFQPTDCATILTQVLANLAVAIQESKAAITYEPLPTVVADTTQLTQLFQNLLSNAIKFCREAAPVIHIGVTPKNEAWLFAVQDNGIGLEAQYSERIFGVFQRLHTRREYPGTGIGLAVCKKIVERHGGQIWVESVPGQGSTFFFTIPAMR